MCTQVTAEMTSATVGMVDAQRLFLLRRSLYSKLAAAEVRELVRVIKHVPRNERGGMPNLPGGEAAIMTPARVGTAAARRGAVAPSGAASPVNGDNTCALRDACVWCARLVGVRCV